MSVDSDDYPVCPHCNKPYKDFDDGRDIEDGGDFTAVECPHCEKLFDVRTYVYVSYSYITEKHEEGEP